MSRGQLSRSARAVLEILRACDHRLGLKEIRSQSERDGMVRLPDAGTLIAATIDLEELGLIEVTREHNRLFYRANMKGRAYPL